MTDFYACQWCNAMDTNGSAFKNRWKKFTQPDYKQLSWKKYQLWHQMLWSKLKKRIETPVVYIGIPRYPTHRYNSAGLQKKEVYAKVNSAICHTEWAIVKSVEHYDLTISKKPTLSSLQVAASSGWRQMDQLNLSLTSLLNEKCVQLSDHFIEQRWFDHRYL